MIRINTFIPVQHFLEELRQTRMRLLVESARPHHRWSFMRSIQPGNMPIDLVLIRINQFVIGLFRLMIFVSRHYMKGCDMPRLHVVDPTTETVPTLAGTICISDHDRACSTYSLIWIAL